ncbi:MAG: hypothetical protein JSS29_16545 [Proteobacteria bacterium]|nr:hypothetical protein [Pseudomonadota bacterium]
MKIKNSIVSAVLFAGATAVSSAGISGGGAAVSGISGGGAAVNGISGGGAPASARGTELLLIGPVESVDAVSQSATVLGQKIVSSSAAVLKVGDSVSVYGSLNSDGSIAVSHVQLRGPYVAGASQVLLTGFVQKVDSSVGRSVVGGVAVDLTPSIVALANSPEIGARAQISGIQPVARGVVLVNGISGGGAAVSGISGGGAAVSGISGGGAAVNGLIVGRHTNGISGGGAAVSGISGGGAAVNGISGGGAAVSGVVRNMRTLLP